MKFICEVNRWLQLALWRFTIGAEGDFGASRCSHLCLLRGECAECAELLTVLGRNQAHGGSIECSVLFSPFILQVGYCLQAAEQLAAEGIEAEV